MTPAALASETAPWVGTGWRLVEAQHLVSTLKLTDTTDEQALLEELIDETKPAVPPECQHLHYLLSTPFRYGAAYPHGSRFRRAGLTDGVLYASEQIETALAETAFYRLLFFSESPATATPDVAFQFSAFSIAIAAAAAIDLTKPPFASDWHKWTDPVNYAHCQSLADAARQAGVQLIRYGSVRAQGEAENLAVLTCSAFSRPDPVERQTWRMQIGHQEVAAICEFPYRRLAYEVAAFASDPRLARFRNEPDAGDEAG